MENLLLYEEFNFNFFKREMDDYIEKLFTEIQKDFDINNLEFIEEEISAVNSKYYKFIYNYNGQTLSVVCRLTYSSEYGNSPSWLAYLNGTYIRGKLSKKIIKNIYEYFKKEYNNKEKYYNKIEKNDVDPLGEEDWGYTKKVKKEKL